MSAGADAVADRLGSAAEPDAPLGARTTYRVGGRAAVGVDVADAAALRRCADALAGADVRILVLGRGSNLLVADAGWAGVVLHLGDAFAEVEVAEGGMVTAGGSTPLPVLARRTAAAGRTGLEWCVGVPGTVGGAVRMNAGGHGSDVAATLVDVTVVDLRAARCEVVAAGDLALGYRSSALADHQLVAAARFRTRPGDPRRSAAEIEQIVRWRRRHQPGGQNSGSVFTNPPGDSAGRLIDTAGGKGLRIGTAHVSTKHANFVQAEPGGSADDVAAVIAEVRRLVLRHHGVDLRPEVRMIGFGADR